MAKYDNLDEKAQEWIRKHYKHTKNKEIAEKFGISESKLHRFARGFGLKKTAAFMRKTNEEAMSKARCEKERIMKEEPDRYKTMMDKAKKNLSDHRMKYCFKKGEGINRFSKRKQKEIARKAHERIEELRSKDRARVSIGLKPRTKLPLGIPSRQRRSLYTKKWYLEKRYGYVAGEGRTVFYNEETRRSARSEAFYSERHKIRFAGMTPNRTDRNDAKETRLPPSWKDRQGGFNI